MLSTFADELGSRPQQTQLPGGLFLDRDGTVIVHIPYLHDPRQVVVVPGAADALAAARRAGFRLYLFTNQSGVGRGLFGMDAVHAVNQRMVELLGLGSDVFAAICIAPEAPEQPSLYRKPSPRFILETCQSDGLDPSRCWMVGDSPSDWEAGLRAGIRSVAVDVTSSEAEDRRRCREALGVPGYSDLSGAISSILQSSGH